VHGVSADATSSGKMRTMIGDFRSDCACASPNPQYPIPFQPGELSRGIPMLLLRPLEQPHDLVHF
jgi:hypothetical protein